MKPMGLKPIRFPSKVDHHIRPKSEYMNWWEDISSPYNNKTERQEVKRDLEKYYK